MRTIKNEETDMTLGNFLVTKGLITSFAEGRRMVAGGFVGVDGMEAAHLSQRVEQGQTVSVGKHAQKEQT